MRTTVAALAVTGQYTDADYAAEAARVRTGVCPVDAEWDRARTAHAAADRLITFTGLSLPVSVREALDALGGLLAVWDGDGEDE